MTRFSWQSTVKLFCEMDIGLNGIIANILPHLSKLVTVY